MQPLLGRFGLDQPLRLVLFTLDETAYSRELAPLAGFNDDTRAFASIPARHDLWRRAGADGLAGRVRHMLVEREAGHLARAWPKLARQPYRLEKT